MGGPCGFQAELHSAKAMKTAVFSTTLRFVTSRNKLPVQVFEKGSTVPWFLLRLSYVNVEDSEA